MVIAADAGGKGRRRAEQIHGDIVLPGVSDQLTRHAVGGLSALGIVLVTVEVADESCLGWVMMSKAKVDLLAKKGQVVVL